MITLLKSVFQTLKNTATTSTLTSQSVPQEDLSSADPQNNTWVYIWNMTSNKVGHAAVQIGGSSPKITGDEPGEYISLHPDSIPSTGLTSVLPLPAHLAGTLSEDMEIIASSRNTTNISADKPLVTEQESAPPVRPDQVLKIKGLDANAMRDYIRKTQAKVETGEESYQLFPNINLVGFINDSATFINQDPIDVWIHQKLSKKYQQADDQVDNCTSLVSKILNVGGLHINPSKMPWSITPNGLADEIKNRPS